jgi:hypothetical protein
MHLRHLIVLIIDARNMPHTLVSQGPSSDRNEKPRLTAWHLIGQIKKPKFTWIVASPLGCRVKQSNKPSLYDVERSGSRSVRGRQLPNLLSVCDVMLNTVPRMVEPDGIEPTTSCLQSTRSPN